MKSPDFSPSTVFWDLFWDPDRKLADVSFGHGSIQNDWGKNLGSGSWCSGSSGSWCSYHCVPWNCLIPTRTTKSSDVFQQKQLPGSFGHHAGDGCQSAWDPGQSNKKITPRSGPFVGCLRVILQQRHQVWHIGIMSIYDISWIYPPGWQWQTKVSILQGFPVA